MAGPADLGTGLGDRPRYPRACHRHRLFRGGDDHPCACDDPQRPYSCRLNDDEQKKCALGGWDNRTVERLKDECLRDGGRPWVGWHLTIMSHGVVLITAAPARAGRSRTTAETRRLRPDIEILIRPPFGPAYRYE